MDQKQKEELKKKLKGKDLHKYFDNLYKATIETLLEAELDEHLGYPKNKNSENKNSRNGLSKKDIKTKLGEYSIEVPRDRNGSFEPKIVPKRKKMIDMIEEKILLLYSKGMSVRDISESIEDIYGLEVDKASISRITDKILPKIEEWQNRPLDRIYLVVWMDAIHIKIRENYKLLDKSVNIVMGLNSQGKKEVLGLWVSEEESAAFWYTVLTDLKARGVEDILISSTDNLKGFADTIKNSFGKTITQVCVVHQIRNTLKYVVYKDKKAFSELLRKVYKAPNKEVAYKALEALEERWGHKYPTPIRSWFKNWENISNYFAFPAEIRKIIYTTNTIENLNRNIRKYTKNKTQFSTEKAAIKSVYLACRKLEKTWTKPIDKWGLILNQFKDIFGERLKDVNL